MQVQRSLRTPIGLFLLALSIYLLTNPGRLDSVDGLVRFDVALSWLTVGRPILRDPVVAEWAGVRGRNGELYAFYGAGPSLAGLPLVWLGGLVADPIGETRRFLFAWTSSFYGALLAALLYAFYRELEVPPRNAVGWTLVSSFATLLWPASTTVLEQVEHAVLVLLATFLGYRAARRGSLLLAAAAGLAGGLLLTFQESYVLLIPLLAPSTFGEGGGERTESGSGRRALVYLTASTAGLALWLSYNYVRFDAPFFSGRLLVHGYHHPLLGNPIRGLAGLLFSPGKSVLLYSPPILLAALGLPGLRRRAPRLAKTVLFASAFHVALLASLAFWHGDWSWGPRYLIPLLPLWALAFPFIRPSAWRRPVAATIVVAGVAVQLLGLAVVHERFFYQRGLPTYFWASDPSFYFRESALFARIGEVWSIARHGVPEEATAFAPQPYQGVLTYSIRGVADPRAAPDWMRRFQIFHLGRPWTCWIWAVDRSRYELPVRRPGALAAALVATLALGGVFVLGGLRNATASAAAPRGS